MLYPARSLSSSTFSFLPPLLILRPLPHPPLSSCLLDRYFTLSFHAPPSPCSPSPTSWSTSSPTPPPLQPSALPRLAVIKRRCVAVSLASSMTQHNTQSWSFCTTNSCFLTFDPLALSLCFSFCCKQRSILCILLFVRRSRVTISGNVWHLLGCADAKELAGL